MGAEVFGERVDPLGEERHLDPGRPGIGFVQAMLGHHAALVVTHAAVFASSIFASNVRKSM
jgi:hypothetical protein